MPLKVRLMQKTKITSYKNFPFGLPIQTCVTSDVSWSSYTYTSIMIRSFKTAESHKSFIVFFFLLVSYFLIFIYIRFIFLFFCSFHRQFKIEIYKRIYYFYIRVELYYNNRAKLNDLLNLKNWLDRSNCMSI